MSMDKDLLMIVDLSLSLDTCRELYLNIAILDVVSIRSFINIKIQFTSTYV